MHTCPLSTASASVSISECNSQLRLQLSLHPVDNLRFLSSASYERIHTFHSRSREDENSRCHSRLFTLRSTSHVSPLTRYIPFLFLANTSICSKVTPPVLLPIPTPLHLYLQNDFMLLYLYTYARKHT